MSGRCKVRSKIAQGSDCSEVGNGIPEDGNCKVARRLFNGGVCAGTTEYRATVAVAVPAGAMVFGKTSGTADSAFVEIRPAKGAERLLFRTNDPQP